MDNVTRSYKIMDRTGADVTGRYPIATRGGVRSRLQVLYHQRNTLPTDYRTWDVTDIANPIDIDPYDDAVGILSAGGDDDE